MTSQPLSKPARGPEPLPIRWSMVVQTLTRPYWVTVPMLVLVSLIPLYVFIPEIIAGRELLVPDVPLDHLVP